MNNDSSLILLTVIQGNREQKLATKYAIALLIECYILYRSIKFYRGSEITSQVKTCLLQIWIPENALH